MVKVRWQTRLGLRMPTDSTRSSPAVRLSEFRTCTRFLAPPAATSFEIDRADARPTRGDRSNSGSRRKDFAPALHPQPHCCPAVLVSRPPLPEGQPPQ